MAIYKLLLPKMGESVSEATLTKWVKQVGDSIEEDDAIVEIATDKVDSDVPSPVTGVLKEHLFGENDVVQVGEAIALIEIEGEQADLDVEESDVKSTESTAIDQPPATHTVESPESNQEIPGTAELAQAAGTPQTEDETSASLSSSIRFYSPLVRNIAQQEGVSQQELDRIAGTGGEGRVTKDDILNYLQNRAQPQSQLESSETSEAVSAARPAPVAPVSTAGADHSEEIIEMDRMRRLIADHMSQSVKTSPHVFSVVEADVTNLVNWRNRIKADYQKKEGENITYTPLFIEAVSKAIRDFPMINVSVEGYNIIKKRSINIGMATALPSGNLIVPVIKNVDQLSLTGISRSVNDLAKRARSGALKPDDTQGGTFTFTNIGAFGNIFGMPIINQPQAAIMAVGTIKKKPAVLETEQGDVIAIRHMMYISMSYDHRVIDGALGGQFIRRVADYLENWNKDRTL